MITKGERLWTKVITTKYARDHCKLANIKSKPGASNAWRGIVKAMARVKDGIRMQIHNGKDTSFWNDSWLDNIPLRNWVNMDDNNHHNGKVVADYWSAENGRDWETIGNSIPYYLCRKMELMFVTNNDRDQDEIYWAHEGSGKLSVNSAYNCINNLGFMVQDKKWINIWKLKVPNKMRMLMWLIMH